MSNPYPKNTAAHDNYERQQAQSGIQTGSVANQKEYARIGQEKSANSPFGNNSASGCFPRGTKIATPTGYSSIETLRPGDMIQSWCCRTAGWVNVPVLKVVKYSERALAAITFSDGQALRVTAAHSLRTANGWRKVSQLRPGDLIATDAGEGLVSAAISSIALSSDKEPVYNLVTAYHHNFVAGGVLAHNFTYFRSLRMLAWRLYTFFALSARDRYRLAETKTRAACG